VLAMVRVAVCVVVAGGVGGVVCEVGGVAGEAGGVTVPTLQPKVNTSIVMHAIPMTTFFKFLSPIVRAESTYTIAITIFYTLICWLRFVKVQSIPRHILG
jgi:hypothetical protein